MSKVEKLLGGGLEGLSNAKSKLEGKLEALSKTVNKRKRGDERRGDRL